MMREKKASTEGMKLFWFLNTKVGHEELQEDLMRLKDL